MELARAGIVRSICLVFVVLAAGTSRGEIVEFGWYGTVSGIDPAFAAALPIGSGIGLGSPAFVRFEFESTAADQNPGPSAGDYTGAVVSFRTRIGSLAFDQQVGGAANSIVVLADALFRFYEAVASVEPSTPIPAYPDIRGDVLFVPVFPTQLPDDDLILVVPDPDAWMTASSGLLSPSGAVLLDIDLVAICVGTCQPVPEPGAALALAGGVTLLGGFQARRRRLGAARVSE